MPLKILEKQRKTFIYYISQCKNVFSHLRKDMYRLTYPNTLTQFQNIFIEEEVKNNYTEIL